jgi:polyisoprenoid-binding protein YceI
MKRLLFLLLAYLFFIQADVLAQNRYFTRSGRISFFSEAPLENIEAHTEQVTSFVDLKTGDMVFSVPMKAFQFRKSLMQEHFNENFVESDKYPKGTFKGKITNIQIVDPAKDNTYQVNVEGTLTIHGVARAVKTEGTLQVNGNRIQGRSTFSITPQEFDIEIPLLVREHIAKRIDITVDMLYEPFTAQNQ